MAMINKDDLKIGATFTECAKCDKVEVVHGRWIQGESVLDKDGGGSIYHCSECGDWYHNFVPNYCPNCGAKMDGDGNAAN